MEKSKHIKTGEIGEDIASAYISKNGYKVIRRNYREKSGEIDIVATSPDGVLVFFEVKTMSNLDVINKLHPEDNFTKSKLKKLKVVCLLFAAKHPKIINSKMGWRIDLLAITINKSRFVIHHYKNVCG
jgi:putative endonuclease